MGVRMGGPGRASGLFDPKMVDALIEAEKMPIETAKKREEKYKADKKEYQNLQKMIGELDGSLNGLKNQSDFYKMKVESSHPDIIDGTIKGYTMTGTYEFEVRGMAKSEKQLAYGFPDKDETPVGFGWMTIEREGEEDLDVTIEPGSNLQDAANAINQADGGVRAMVINTKYQPDPYRLLVISEKSGKESKIKIDEDTTFMEFKEQVKGRDLDVLFEDVPVADNDNTLESLLDNVVFNVKRSEPGTRVQVSITHDIDETFKSIKGFVDKYNEVSNYINTQSKVDPNTNRGGSLSGDGSLKTIQRQLQSAIGFSLNKAKKYNTLADIGITTEAKTGALTINETKVRGALADDYDGVAALFIRSRNSTGVAQVLSDRIRDLRDPQSGVLQSRVRGLDSIIKSQDGEIERKERNMEKKEEEIRRRFSALEGTLSGLKSQGDFLAQKFGSKGD